jgi:HPt (histidine-containing phosphotransfer) domain-containing protein
MKPPFVYSSLAADPDLGELAEMFAQEMPGRISNLETLARNRDWPLLRQTAHQLKGSSGSYGFHDLSPYAAKLEATLKESCPEEAILAALEELLDVCGNVRSGVPQCEVG